MTQNLVLALIAVCSLQISCAHNTAKNPSTRQGISTLQMEELFQPSPLVRLSPDGSRLAITGMHHGAPAVRILATANLNEPTIHSFPTTYGTIRDLFWKNPRQLVLCLELKQGGSQQILSLDTELKTQKVHTPESDLRQSLFHALTDNSKDEILILSNRQNPDALDVYRLNLESNKVALSVKNPGTIAHWVADSKGRVRLALGLDGSARTLYFRASENIPFKKILTVKTGDFVEPVGLAPDGSSFYARSNVGRENIALILMNGATGKEISTIAAPAKADVLSVWQDPSGRLVGHFSEFLTPQWTVTDERLRSLHERIQGRLPGNVVTIEQTSADGKIYLIRGETDRAPASHSIYFETGDSLLPVNAAAEGPATAIQTETHVINFEGAEVAAYVTRPLQARTRATLLWFPSGPEDRFHWTFAPEVNFLASQGIAIVRILPRGTPGMGRQNRTQGQKQWGQQRLVDAVNMVKHLKDKNILGSERVCSYGMSLGGTEALLASALDSGLIRCSIARSPILNLPAHLENTPPYWEARRDFLYEMLGHPVKDRLSLLKASPLFRAKDFRAPLFVAHGSLDPHTTVAELDQWIELLRAQGVKTQVLKKPGEGHSWSDPEALAEFRTQLVRFVLD